MFWKKRTTHKFPLIIFGIVALGIIISGIVLMIILFQHKADFVRNQKILTNTTNKTIDLQTKYFSEIENLVVSNNNDNSKSNIFSSTKNVLLNVRVPQEMRDIHLQTFLGVIRLEDSQDILELREVQEKVNNFLGNILVLKTE